MLPTGLIVAISFATLFMLSVLFTTCDLYARIGGAIDEIRDSVWKELNNDIDSEMRITLRSAHTAIETYEKFTASYSDVHNQFRADLDEVRAELRMEIAEAMRAASSPPAAVPRSRSTTAVRGAATPGRKRK